MSAPPCPSCGADPGQLHHPDCDIARCLATGLQSIACDQPHDHGADRWTGSWPGEAECREYGWMQPPPFDDLPDLNRLHLEAAWDPHARRWTRTEPDQPTEPRRPPL